MSRSPMQISNELKEELERRKAKSGASSLGEVIEDLIRLEEVLNNELEKEKMKKEQLLSKIEFEYVFSGENLKTDLERLRKELLLISSTDLIEFLMHNYDGSNNISKMGFLKYTELKR